ncbi:MULTISPECIES: EAL domain-containing protein [unclassified Acinetobacter]|uniref:sensor domain-containing protein n=1 Tax=unclassified Acinetobacter TaxID=196816 RepID=UPI0025779047|nr:MULTISPECIES: EAL domain-containing protein [unclassified Acinetobacter]MDM1763624.1 EAL domain-containing protein [Acinetobacter sp. 226-1]MDM1767103.1 EAL domain-containing protein [Acinetobacter sp. 226-4]
MVIDVQDELLYTSQIKSAAVHLQRFLVCLFGILAYVDLVHFFYFESFSFAFNLWFISISILLSIFWLLIKATIASPYNNTFNLDALCQFICLVLGCILGFGVFNLHHYVNIDTPNMTLNHLIILSGILIFSTSTISILYLSNRFRYFLFLFIPFITPCILYKFIFFTPLSTYYQFTFNFIFLFIIICAFIVHRYHTQLSLLSFKNNKFSLQETQLTQDKNQLGLNLKNAVEKSNQMQNELLLHNQLLEQKVKERIYDIKQINDRLENHQANLAFAHETAGINSWLWNIEKRSIEIFDTKSKILFNHISENEVQFESLIHPDDLDNYQKLMRQHLRGKTERFEARYRIKRDQQWCWIQDTGKVVARHPMSYKPLRMVGIHRDIQKEKTDQEQLKLAANVFEHVAEGVFVLDNNLCYLEVNPYFEKLTSYHQSDLLGKHLFDITVNTKKEILSQHFDVTKKLIADGEYDAELQIEFLTGKVLTLWVHINAVTDEKNKIINYIGIITDLTERKKQEQRVSYLENYDLLTDLPNRFYFNLQLHHYLTDPNDSIQNLAVIRINIDRFRSFNEFVSTQAGDILLQKTAQRLRHSCPDALLISYLNNDDFAIIYKYGQNKKNIQQIAKKILEAFESPFVIQNNEHFISTSIGIALYPEHGRQIDTLNSHAEQALAEAKSLGGNTAYFYTNKNTRLFHQGVNLEGDLRQALKNKELLVYYQPKICTKTEKVYGFEALIRWQHPKLGLLTPDIFLPIAEESSLITEIGRFVLFETCKQIRIWQDLNFDYLRISVNVVAQQIHRGELIHDIDQALELYNVSGDMLELEITESSLIAKSENVLTLLQQVKHRHISISLDDFGTGYSSLAYLINYPIDTLKIDKLFIAKIEQEKDQAIVSAIIAMGKAMGLSIVAEGVETIEQINFLKKHDCHILQGYYYSKPLTAQECIDYLSKFKLASVYRS